MQKIRQFSQSLANFNLHANGLLTICLRESKTSTIRIQWSYNNLPGRRYVAHPSRPIHIEHAVLNGQQYVSIQCHYGTCMDSQNESHSFYVLLNCELPHKSGILGSQLAARQCYQVALETKHPTSDEAHPKPSNAMEQQQLEKLG